MHVLTSVVFDLLDQLVRENVRELGQIQLTTALNSLAARNVISHSKPAGPGLIWGSSSAWSRLRSLWRWGRRPRTILALLFESMIRIERNTAR